MNEALTDLQKTLIGDNSGFALIIIIMIVCLIVPLTLEFHSSTAFNKISAANYEYGTQLGCAAKSGVHYAFAVLYEDGISTNFDSPHETWWTNSDSLPIDNNTIFEDVGFGVKIRDLNGRININRLVDADGDFETFQQDMLFRLFKSLKTELEDDDIDDILNSIKDWIDADDIDTDVGGMGAESSYYEDYACPNAPMSDLEELRLVKGISDEVYDEISEFLTIYGDGNININTADEKVLVCLFDPADSQFATDMVEYRKDFENDLSTVDWYKSVPGMAAVSLSNITTSSTHFEIIASGSKNHMKKEITCHVERTTSPPFQILSWRVN